MIFREITFGSAGFQKALQLRNEILRVPLGLSFDAEDLDLESEQLHFGLCDSGGELVACVIAAPVSSVEAKIRQMAVALGHQGKGFGRQVIQSLERELEQRGFLHLWLHARLPAIVFYEKMGYRGAGDEFVEVGIPHLKMEKDLPAPG